MNRAKQVKIGAILSYLSIIINIVAGIIYTPWMVRQIGKSDYGLFTLANSLITLFLIDFGLSSATARYLSKYHAEGDEEKADAFLGVVYKLYLIIDAVIFVALVVFFFLIDGVYVKLTPEELRKFKVVYVIAGGFAIFNFPFITLNGVLTAYEKFVPLKLADVIYRLLIVGLMVCALFLGYGLYALVSVTAFAGFVVIVFKYIVIKRTVPIKANFKFSDKSLYKELFGFSIWVTLASLAQRLIFNITPSILGIVADSNAIAVFGVVTTIEGYVYTITSAINGMFMPKISRIYANTDTETDITPLLLKVGRFQYALNGLLVVGFAIVGNLFIRLWMGADYIDAYYGILLVCIPGIFSNSLQIANTAMIVKKRVDLQAYVNIGMGLINIGLSFILSKYYGVIGACVSIFVAYTFRAIVLNIICYKVMRINIPLFIKECYLKMFVPLFLTLLFCGGLNYIWVGNSWSHLCCKALIVSVAFFVSIAFCGVTKSERDWFLNKLKGRIKKNDR